MTDKAITHPNWKVMKEQYKKEKLQKERKTAVSDSVT